MMFDVGQKAKKAIGIFAIMAAFSVSGCATPPPEDDPEALADFRELNDPLEPTNRVIFAVNDVVDQYAVRPVTQVYRHAIPPAGRNRVNDVLNNLSSPFVLANNLLQGDGEGALTTVGRFLLNSTFGVLGIMDVATPMGLDAQPADFGETLAVWGVGEGPYLVLPLVGPSNPRDAVGLGVAWFADPVSWYLKHDGYYKANYIYMATSVIDTRNSLFAVLDDVRANSFDHYAAMRSLARQNRAAQISRKRSHLGIE